MIARPFLKWAGGKTKHLDEIVKRFPASSSGYYREPFLGGGAVFFRLQAEGRLKGAFLADANEELIRTYRAVRDDVEPVIGQLEGMPNEREFFLEVRNQHWDDETDLASRFIYLNKTAFNGLYRVNSKGRFNVPFADYPNPHICDAANLRACSEALKVTMLEWCDFKDTLSITQKGDLVYLDPPYPDSFTAYTSGRFGPNDHVRLRDEALRLVRLGAHVVLSNADLPFVRDLYSKDEFLIETVAASRSVGAAASTRKRVTELIVTGRP